MFDIGFWELIFIFGLGLLILGPEKLPRVARNVGQWVAQARSVARRFQREIEREVAIADVRRRYESDVEADPAPPAPENTHCATPPPAAMAANAPHAEEPVAESDSVNVAGDGAGDGDDAPGPLRPARIAR